MANQAKIQMEQPNILRALDSHENNNKQVWAEERELNHEELRRLDDLYQKVDPLPQHVRPGRTK
jgi:hypothetical protein